MKKYSIPSANYEIYTDSEKAISELNKFNTPIVVKADGLAAGKGVLICETHEEAKEAIKSIMVKASVAFSPYMEGMISAYFALMAINDMDISSTHIISVLVSAENVAEMEDWK